MQLLLQEQQLGVEEASDRIPEDSVGPMVRNASGRASSGRGKSGVTQSSFSAISEDVLSLEPSLAKSQPATMKSCSKPQYEQSPAGTSSKRSARSTLNNSTTTATGTGDRRNLLWSLRLSEEGVCRMALFVQLHFLRSRHAVLNTICCNVGTMSTATTAGATRTTAAAVKTPTTIKDTTADAQEAKWSEHHGVIRVDASALTSIGDSTSHISDDAVTDIETVLQTLCARLSVQSSSSSSGDGNSSSAGAGVDFEQFYSMFVNSSSVERSEDRDRAEEDLDHPTSTVDTPVVDILRCLPRIDQDALKAILRTFVQDAVPSCFPVSYMYFVAISLY